ncbi:phage tail protein [Novosphingobium sp.]|uniref:phage tail protein n=1 Tax=Novosphingobium sp. TaxID=1874826 RepID=UPI00286D6C8C|nr:phage tail protein [Novosphingobium sp.]
MPQLIALAVTAVAGALGASTLVAGIIGIAASVGSSLLFKPGAKAQKNSQENIDRLRASIDPRTPRKTVVGITALATDIRDEEFTSDQSYFNRFIVVASHKINAINEIWFDDKLAWSVGGGVASEFSGYLWITPILEGSAGNAINLSARMGATRRYTGLAYVHIKYKLTGNTSKTDSPFAQSITTRITIRGEGAALYDPRLDSTVVGGSGSHRPDDQATWIWDDDACRNPALALLFYLLGYKIAGLPAVGKGIPADRIDLESFAIAANICDETVSTDAGSEPRYRCDGVWSEGDAPTTVIDMLKACMNADLDDVDGKLRLTIFHNDLASIDAEFTADDVLGGFEWQRTPSLDQTFNIVRGIYTDPSNDALYQPVDYPQVAIASPDGIDRINPFDLPMVESPFQAQRLAGLRLRRQQYGAGTFKAEFQATAWAVQKNSVVRLTFPPAGIVNKLFRVAEMELRVDGTVPLLLREESEDIYDAPTLEAPIEAVPSTPYDPALNPIIGAVADLNGQVVGITNGAAYGTISGTTTTTSMVAVGPEMIVDAGPLGIVDLAATYSFTVVPLSGTYGEYAQWYMDVAGTYTAQGTEEIHSLPNEPDIGQVGDGACYHSVTGLTPSSTYKFRLYMRNAAGTTTRTISGFCGATPS